MSHPSYTTPTNKGALLTISLYLHWLMRYNFHQNSWFSPLTLDTWEDFLSPGCSSRRPTYQQLLDLALLFFSLCTVRTLPLCCVWSHAGILGLPPSARHSCFFRNPHAADLLLPQGIWCLGLLCLLTSFVLSPISAYNVILHVGIGSSSLYLPLQFTIWGSISIQLIVLSI